MNGVHDIGGMQDMGRVPYNKNEPVFHSAWEARTFALYVAIYWANADVPLDYEVQLLPPAEYLHMSYYERWLAAMERRLEKAGIVTQNELATGKAVGSKPVGRHALAVAEVPKLIEPPTPNPPSPVSYRFKLGQSVRAKDINPLGATRLPRYVRGRGGRIVQLFAPQACLDTDASGRDAYNKPAPVYSVRFESADLWGKESGRNDSTYVDMYEDYIEPA